MTNLVTKRSPMKMLSGKRPLEYLTFGARFIRDIKRPRVSAIRQFPPGCGPAACDVRETCNGGGILVKTSNERFKARPSHPFIERLPTKGTLDKSMKPRVKMLPDELKSEPIKAPALQGNTFSGNVKMGLLRVPRKVDLINARSKNFIPEPIGMLCGSYTSPKPSLLSKKCPSPKFRKGITVFQEFPRGRGRRDLDMSSECDVLPRYKSIDARPGMLQAVDEKNITDGAKSRVVRNGGDSEEYIRSKSSDGGILPATQEGVKTSDCMAATGATDGCNDKKCNVNNGSRRLLRKHVDTKTNFLDRGSGQYDALPDQKHNSVLSEVLDLFEHTLNKRLLEIGHEEKSTGRKRTSNLYTEIAMQLKKQGKWIYMNRKLLGAIPGIEVGDQFRYRAELVIVGLHIQFIAGIDYMEKDGKKIATI
ncbi:histone-lysine N-methyltransferase, H3 lysine-9 specific SUVH5-like [Apium graveolens]|uniref:histone-lysine N-methyltransferase, H3 lysine-9 specific SUVH5-like n=1 Tax=Apium graveolens TaxID=4045 RepID=UPI003D7B49A2